MISHSSEFENIVPREDEIPELETLRRNRRIVPVDIKASLTDKVGKVNLLLQVYIWRQHAVALAHRRQHVHFTKCEPDLSRVVRALFETRMAVTCGAITHGQ